MPHNVLHALIDGPRSVISVNGRTPPSCLTYGRTDGNNKPQRNHNHAVMCVHGLTMPSHLSECFHSRLTHTELKSRMQSIVDCCGCHASKQRDSRDRGLISTLPIPHCANSLSYVDYINTLPRFEAMSVVWLSPVVRHISLVHPRNKNVTQEQSVKDFVEQWLEPFRAPKEVHSDDDVRIWSDAGWYKRVSEAPSVHVTTGVPYTHTSYPVCKRRNRVVEQNLKILMKQEHTKDGVCLLPWAV